MARSCNASFAALELYALANAHTGLVTCSDHPEAIRTLGCSKPAVRLLGPGAGPARPPSPRGASRLLVVADHEGEIDTLRPLFQQVVPLLLSGRVQQVAMLSHGSWSRPTVDRNVMGLGPCPAGETELRSFTSALLVPGMMRHVAPMFSVMAAVEADAMRKLLEALDPLTTIGALVAADGRCGDVVEPVP